MAEEKKETLKFQRQMNYKAYRRKEITFRVAVTLLISGAMVGAFVTVSTPLTILMPIITACLGAIWLITLFKVEQTVMVFDSRFVVKKLDKRVDVELKDVIDIKYHRAFYEKDLATGTVTVTAYVKCKKSGSKKRRIKMYHIFDAMPIVEYIKSQMTKGRDVAPTNADAPETSEQEDSTTAEKKGNTDEL